MSTRAQASILTIAIAPIVIIGWYCSLHYLPAITKRPPWTNTSFANWFGMSLEISIAFGFLTIIVIYFVKAMLFLSQWPRLYSVYIYLLVILASLPFIWFFTSCTWNNALYYRVSCWVGDPIAVSFVPTATFAVDVLSKRDMPFGKFLSRSFVEVLLCIPVWFWLWHQFSLVVLGWGV